MLRRGICATTVIVIVVSAVGILGQQAVPATSGTVSYEEFMRLSTKQRQAQFGQLSADNKSMLLRTHAEQWLAKNRTRLGASQSAVIQEAIAFVRPELFQKPLDPQILKQQQDVEAKFRCRVNPADVSAAFDVLGSRSSSSTEPVRWTYLNQAKCWLGWLAEGLVDYLPASKPAR